MPSILVLGARHLGGAIVDRFAANGYDVAAVSLSQQTADGVRRVHPEALALSADVSDARALADVVAQVRERFGSLDVAVNAVSPVRSGIVSAGPLTELTVDAIEPYTRQLVPAVFNFLRVCGAAMANQESGKLIQITGGSARRAMPGRGPWASAAFATRAMVNASSQELRERKVHAALLIVDAIIESDKTTAMLNGRPEDYSTTHDVVVDAVEYLVRQSPRGWSHELTITPVGDRWVP